MGKKYVGCDIQRNKNLCSRGSDHVHDHPSIWATFSRQVPSMGCSSSLFYTQITLQREKIMLPAVRRFRCRPGTVILGCLVQTSTCREQLNCSQLYFGLATYIIVGLHLYESGQSMAKFSNLSSRTRDG